MRPAAHTLASLLLSLAVISCVPEREPITVKIPAGFMAVTKAQQELVAGVKTLSRGMSQAEVIARLGPPATQETDLLFYDVVEHAEGGYYVTATLAFDKGGLSAAELGLGHVSMTPRRE